jgi:hypothetical protein
MREILQGECWVVDREDESFYVCDRSRAILTDGLTDSGGGIGGS